MIIALTEDCTLLLSLICTYGANRYADADAAGLNRFERGLAELQSLDSDWDSIVRGNGDNVRRRLGTVYKPPLCESPLCSMDSFIPKFVKAHPDDLDLLSFEGPASEFLQALNQADFLAYSSMFSDYGNGGGGADYIADSHEQVKKAAEALQRAIEAIKASDS